MYTVRSIEIDGFWSTRKIKVEFDKNINFLIGKNGCGKTTLINMLAATLKLDIEELNRQVFKKIN